MSPPQRRRKRHPDEGVAEASRAVGVSPVEPQVDFAALVAAVEDYAIFMLSPDGRVASWNAGAQRMKQYSADEILGRHFSVFYPAEEVSAGKCEYELATAAREGRFEEEGWRLRKDGSRFWAQVTITAIRNGDGELAGFAKVTRDLTARKRADEERIRLAQAQEAIRLRDEFLVIAAHELRTPLTALGLQLQRLERSGAAAEVVQAVLRSARRLGALVETLFDVSRIATGQLKLDRRDCDLAELAREVAERWKEEAARAGCELIVEAPAPVRGRWDALRVDQVIENLLGNAIKYAPGKPVRISVAVRGSTAELAVADEGPGVAPGEERRIFERFERTVDFRHYGGMGLGLFIAREIVEVHGGSVSVESGPGKGATFRVQLPVHP